MDRRPFVVILALCIVSIAQADADKEYTLVTDGKATSVIVLPRMPPSHTAMWAAKELQDHIEKISGAVVPICYDDESITSEATVKISVGDTALSRASGLQMGTLGEQEYVMQFEPGLILLMGRDRYPNPWPLEVLDVSYRSAEGAFGLGMQDGQVIWREHAFPETKGSVEIWIRNDTRGNIWKVGGQQGDENGNFHTLYIDEKRNNAVTYSTSVGVKREKLEGPTLEEGWHLITATWDVESGKKQILIDGKVAAEGPFERVSCGAAKYFSINDPSSGVVDEFRLSQNIVRNYPDGAPKEPFLNDDYTKLLLHFDEMGGVTYDGEKPTAALPTVDGLLPDAFSPIGTCHAAYDFLERYCDVRWYFPTDLGTVLPKTKTLTITNPVNIKRKPAIRGRAATPVNTKQPVEWGSLMTYKLWNDCTTAEGELYKFRLRMGGWAINVNHSFYDWYDKYWEKNPKKPDVFVEKHADWFAKDTGKFDCPPDMPPRPPQLCYSHTGVIAQVIADAKLQYSWGKRVFGVVPMDNQFQCQCTDCKAKLDSVTTNKSSAFSSGNASELVWWFTDQVAKGVAKDCPDLVIGQLSYMDYAMPPATLKLSPNISAGPCFAPNVYDSLDDSNLGSEIGMYRQWVNMKKQSGVNLACWIYQCFPNEAGTLRGFKNWPGFHAERLGIYMKMLAEDKVDALFLCGISSYIDGYLTFRMMDDPTLDTAAVLDEFFPRFYGKAGAPLQKFYRAVEASFMEQIGGNGLINSYDRYNINEIITRCGAWMTEAEQLAETDDEKKRVALFKEAVWAHIDQGYKDYLALYNGKPPFPLSYRNDEKPTERVDGKFGNAWKINNTLLGVWNPGFSDQSGTIEFWVKSRETGGVLFNIHTDKPDLNHRHINNNTSGHEIGRGAPVEDTVTQKRHYPYYYRTWVGGKTNEVSTAPLGVGWHHLTARWDANKNHMDLWLDGKLVKTSNYTATSCAKAHRLAIGGVTGTFGTWGDAGTAWGTMDEFHLSTGLRPVAPPTNAPAPDESTLLLLRFDEENGQYPVESSGRDWHATESL